MDLNFYDFKIILLGGTNKHLELSKNTFLENMLAQMSMEINTIKAKKTKDG